jgi:outer membrane protein TolC
VADLERARLLPDLGIVAGVNWAKARGVDDPPSAFANDPFNITTVQAALVLRWTIDPAGQAARIARAGAELERGKAMLEAARRGGDFAVAQAYTRAVETQARLVAARNGEKSARGWVASVLQADAIGTTTSKEIADAYLAYFTLHGRLLQSTYDWNLAVLGLRRATGVTIVPPSPPTPTSPASPGTTPATPSAPASPVAAPPTSPSPASAPAPASPPSAPPSVP